MSKAVDSKGEVRGATHNPLPELFPYVLRRRFIIRIRNHLIQARNEIHILNFHEPALHNETRDGERDRGEHQRDVVGDECGRVPVTTKEDGKSTEDEDYRDRHEAIPRGVGLEGGFEWEEVPVETLGVPASSEAEVGLFARVRILSMARYELERSEGGYARHRSRTTSSGRRWRSCSGTNRRLRM